MSRVLVLRPEPGASETLERARAIGLEAVSAPLFEIEAIGWRAPEATGFDALLLTSSAAIRYGGEELGPLRALPVHAVGKATAAAARDAGFGIASIGEAGVDRLLQSIEPDLRLLHLCGEDRRAPQDARQEITPLAVYRAREIPRPDLSSAEGSVVLIHSPRAGARFAELADAASLDRRAIAVATMSGAALQACGGGWAQAAAADGPNDDALLALAATLCNKLGRG